MPKTPRQRRPDPAGTARQQRAAVRLAANKLAAAKLAADLAEQNNRLTLQRIRAKAIARIGDLADSTFDGRNRGRGRGPDIDQPAGGPLAFTNSFRSGSTRTRRQLGGDGARTPLGPPDAHLDEQTLTNLRRDAQDLHRKSDVGRVLVRARAAFTVGDGSHVLPTTSSEAFNREVERLVRAWWDGVGLDPVTGVHGVDARGLKSGSRLEFDIEQQAMVDGDLALPLLADGTVQVIDADRVTSGPYGRAQYGQDWTRGTAGESCGVLCNGRGAITGIRVANYSKLGSGLESPSRVLPAGSFLWYTNPRGSPCGVNQTRGEPALAAVYEHVLMLERYTESTTLAAYMNSCVVSWTKTVDPVAMQAALTGETIDVSTENGGTARQRLRDIYPGAHWDLEKNEEVGFFNPSQPNAQFDPFVTAMLRVVSAHFGLPMIMAFFDPRGVNLSTFRGLVLAAAQQARVEQLDRVARLLGPLYRWRVAMWIREGRLRNPPADWDAHEWICNPPPVLDPEAEVRMWALAKEKGLATRDMGTRSMWGIPGRRMTDNLVTEQRYDDDAGLVTLTTPGQQVKDAADNGAGPATPADQTDPAAP